MATHRFKYHTWAYELRQSRTQQTNSKRKHKTIGILKETNKWRNMIIIRAVGYVELGYNKHDVSKCANANAHQFITFDRQIWMRSTKCYIVPNRTHYEHNFNGFFVGCVLCLFFLVFFSLYIDDDVVFWCADCDSNDVPQLVNECRLSRVP